MRLYRTVYATIGRLKAGQAGRPRHLCQADRGRGRRDGVPAAKMPRRFFPLGGPACPAAILSRVTNRANVVGRVS